MKITGIVAEYNPFHNGHRYHIEEARRITGADYIIAVISGDFVQRGAPAIMDKYLRADAALKNGADLVLELPLFYAAGSAEYFAMGAVTLLDQLGVVDALCFGSECGSIRELSAAASILAKEPENYRKFLQKELKNGHSFPKARSLALEAVSGNFASEPSLFSSPNNILGTEYMKSLLKRNSSIVPFTIKRRGSQYHDSALPFFGTQDDISPANESSANCTTAPLITKQPLSDGITSMESLKTIKVSEPLSSATALRNLLTEAGTTLPSIRPYVPDSSYSLMENVFRHSFPICSDDFSSLLHYKLLQEAPDGFCRYLDVTDDLSDKICRNLFHFTGYEAFCSLLKSKDITYSRLSRSLLHILLNMTQAQMEEYIQNDYIAYARILGLHKTAAPLFKKIKAHTGIPMVSKLANARRLLSPAGLAMLEQDIKAAHIYDSVVSAKYHVPFTNEYARQLVIIDSGHST